MVSIVSMILQNGIKSYYGWVDLLELYHSGVTWRRYCVPAKQHHYCNCNCNMEAIEQQPLWMEPERCCGGTSTILQWHHWAGAIVTCGGTIQQRHYLLIYLADQSTSFIHWEAT